MSGAGWWRGRPVIEDIVDASEKAIVVHGLCVRPQVLLEFAHVGHDAALQAADILEAHPLLEICAYLDTPNASGTVNHDLLCYNCF